MFRKMWSECQTRIIHEWVIAMADRIHLNRAVFVFMLAAGFAVPTIASEVHLDNQTVALIQPIDGGLLIGFGTLPIGCKGSFDGAHAFLPSNHKKFDDMYLALRMAKIQNFPVSIDYWAEGDCTKFELLLQMRDVTNP